LQTFRTDLRVGEAVRIDGGRVTVRLEEKSGQRARLVFKAEDDIRIEKAATVPRTGAAQAKYGLSM
jgi:pyruvate kinase